MMSEYLFYQFLGPLLDALFIVGLIFPAEPFLLRAGFDIQSSLYTATLMVLLGGFTGDQISYWLGKWKGSNTLMFVAQKLPKTRKHIARSRALFYKKQSTIIVTSRLLGPVNAFIPFLCGSRQVAWHRFTALSTIGLLIAVIQFLIWGALIGTLSQQYSWVNEILLTLKEHIPTLMVLGCALIVLWKVRSLRLATLTIISGLFLINISHFFWLNTPSAPIEHSKEVDYQGLPLNVFPGQSDSYAAQAINVIYIGESPNSLMSALNWTPNKTFSRNNIALSEYLEMLKQSTPPVSDLFWQGQPQWHAWQQPGTLTERNHIRWWYAGKTQSSNQKLWVGSLSYDEHLKLTRYQGFYTVLHDTNPLIDRERNQLQARINGLSNWQTYLTKSWKNYPLINDREYQTDGRLLVIKNKIEI